VRACYAALAMQVSMRSYTDEVRRTRGLELRIRVGLHSGEVVVRAIGNDLHMDYSAVGETTHLAARMEQLATPGSIRLTTETLRLAEGFIREGLFDSVGSHKILQPRCKASGASFPPSMHAHASEMRLGNLPETVGKGRSCSYVGLHQASSSRSAFDRSKFLSAECLRARVDCQAPRRIAPRTPRMASLIVVLLLYLYPISPRNETPGPNDFRETLPVGAVTGNTCHHSPAHTAR
jgi:hypothetical protein